MLKKKVFTDKAPLPKGHYSQAMIVGEFVFVSGQLPINIDGNIPEGISAQTTQALDNIAAILLAAGCNLEDVVETSVYLIQLSDFNDMNEVYSSYFIQDPPARSTLIVSEFPGNILLEISAVAILPE